MRTVLGLLLVVTLVFEALASPINISLKKRESPENTRAFMKLLHLQRQGIFKLSSRFAGPVNLNLTNSLPQGSASYYGPVGLGTPPQVADYDFDTGSSNFWVANVDCTYNCPATGYDHSKSSTYVANGEYLSIQYGSGSATGYLSQDTTTIAGLSVPDVIFGEITSQTSPLSAPTAGIIGLAYRSISQDNDEPLLDYLYAAGLIPTNSFGMYLSTSQSGNRQGQLTLGGVDRGLFTGSLVYTPITDQQWYVINIGGISVQGQNVASATGAIVDSGTSCLAGPTSAVNSLMSFINIGSDCSGLSTAPNVTVTIANRRFTMTPNDYTLQFQGQCQICIQGFDLPSNIPFQWILGDSFMHAYYVHFDKGNNRLGFAKSVPGS